MRSAVSTRRRGRSGPSPDERRASSASLPAWRRVILELYEEGVLAELNDLVVGRVRRASAEVIDDVTPLFDPEIPAMTKASTDAAAELFVRLVRSGAAVTEAEPPPATAALARDFARRGIPMTVMLRGIQVGGWTVWKWGVERLRERLDDPAEVADALEGLADALLAFTDAMAWSMSETFIAERDRWTRSAEARRAEALNELLAGEGIAKPEAERRLAYPLDRHHVAFVVWSDDGSASDAIEGEAARLTAALGDGRSLITRPGERTLWGWVAVHARPPGGFLDSLPAAEAPVGTAIGSPGEGIEGFRRSHAEALEARRIATLAGATPPVLARYPDLALVALATSDLGRAREFVAAELSELAGPGETPRRLARTLAVYLEESSSPRRTSRRLGIHENTVANRVRAAEELLGRPLDRRVAETLVALRLARLLDG